MSHDLLPGRAGTGLRWAGAGALVLALHLGIGWLVVGRAMPPPHAVGGEAAIAVDLEPVEGDDSKTADRVPPPETVGDPAMATAPEAPAMASSGTPAPRLTTPPDPETAPPLPAPAPPEPAPPEPPPVPPSPPAPSPDATAAPRTPPAIAIRPPAPASPPPTAASMASPGAEADEEHAPAARRVESAADAAWRGRLVAHLNRFRRFPPGTAGGTARIGFTLDRQGWVTDLRVATSSGDSALDAAARAIVARASPFPAPPADTGGAALSFVVPVHFDNRRR